MDKTLFDMFSGELRMLVEDTLQRAAAAEFGHVSRNDNRATTLLLTDEESIAAQSAKMRFNQWARDLNAILLRRGYLDEASQLQHNSRVMNVYLGLERVLSGDLSEQDWRTTFTRELAKCVALLTQLLEGLQSTNGYSSRPPREEYDIRISSIDPEHYSVQSRAGSEVVVIQAPRMAIPRDADIEQLVMAGHELYRCVFAGSVGDAFGQAHAEANRRGAGLRIQLSLDDAHAAALPWELMHNGRQFLCLSRGTTIVRRIHANNTNALKSPSRRLPRPPYRVLVTTSSPPSLRALDTQSELHHLRAAVGPLVMRGQMEIITTDGSLDTIRRKLRTAEDSGRPFNIWHFIGHCNYDNAAARSTLAMTDGDGSCHCVTGWELAELFAEHDIQLAILNACESARYDPKRLKAGVATALIETGFTMVLAMQLPLADASATLFTAELYGGLTDGVGFDDAVVNARQAVFFRPDWTGWIAPVVLEYSQNILGYIVVGR